MATARATSKRFKSPWDKVDAFSKAMSEMPANSRASMALASTFLTHSPRFMALGLRQETITLAIMGKRRKGRMFWKVLAMPMFTMSQVFLPVMFLPLNLTVLPRSGRRMPVMRRTRVVLPAPLGPIRPTISSRPMLKLTSLVAVRPPKSL